MGSYALFPMFNMAGTFQNWIFYCVVPETETNSKAYNFETLDSRLGSEFDGIRQPHYEYR